MKKKISYLMLIVISIVGSRLIFGRDYHLNSDNLISENLYSYNIFGNNEVLSYFVDNEILYYIAKDSNNKNNQFYVLKYDLTSNRKINEYIFNDNTFQDEVKLFKEGNYLYLTSLHSNKVYKFNDNIDLVELNTLANNEYDSYGVFNNDIIYTKNNEIYYKNDLMETLPSSCGNNMEIIYDKNTYLHFHNYNTGFGCLYNLSNKEIQYLDYEKLDIVNSHLLEYQVNRLSFKYDDNTYYFNDITESNELEMRSNGDYLFTIDTVNNDLNIYNLDTRKIIYQRNVPELKNGLVENILIDNYAYFTVLKDNQYILYIWDYLKENRADKDMIYYDEKEYKFKNNEIKEELNNKYNIDVKIYDQAVQYYDNLYVIPSYDDILINSRLNTLKDFIEKVNKDVNNTFPKIEICFVKELVFNNLDEAYYSYTISKDNYYVMTFNITDDNFKDNLIKEFSIIYPDIINLFKNNS